MEPAPLVATAIVLVLAGAFSVLAAPIRQEAVGPPTSTGWPVDLVEAPLTTSVTSIDLFPSGMPAIAYAPAIGVVKVARLQDNGSWGIDIVDNGLPIAGGGVHLSVAPSGTVHVAYDGGPSPNCIWQAQSGPTGWSKTGVDDGFCGLVSQAEVRINSTGTPHVAYLKELKQGGALSVMHAQWLGTNWVRETVASVGPGLGWVSMILNRTDVPHILYYDSRNQTVDYAVRGTSGLWSTEIVDHAGDIEYLGRHGSLALSSDGTIHAAYLADVSFATNSSGLRYASRIGGTWHVQTVDGPPGMKGFYPTLLFSDDGLPQIGFQNWGQSFADLDLRYAVFNGSGWSLETIYDSSKGVQFPAFVLDRCNNPHASFYSNDVTGVLYASRGVPCTDRRVSLRVEPRTLNLKSSGQWVTAQVTVANATALEVDAASLHLNVVPVAWSAVVMDNTTLVAKFDRAAFGRTLATGDRVVVTLTGRWKDGSTFTATDSIRVIRPGR